MLLVRHAGDLFRFSRALVKGVADKQGGGEVAAEARPKLEPRLSSIADSNPNPI